MMTFGIQGCLLISWHEFAKDCYEVYAYVTRLGIRGTQVKASIQDIVDEVAPIKKAPLWD
jgi:hypothetical protein